MAASDPNSLEYLRVYDSDSTTKFYQLIAKTSGLVFESVTENGTTVNWQAALKSDLSNFMQYMGAFSGDFNNLKIATGIYLIDALNSYSNGPKTWNPSYCIFIQYPGSHFHFQHLISTNKMATRRYAGAPPIWEPWNIFSGVAET